MKFGMREIEGEPKQWLWNPVRNALVNVKGFGIVQVFEVFDTETGEGKYEGITLSEGIGEVDVVIDEDGNFAFVEQDRFVVIPPEHLNEIWDKGVPDVFAIEQIGYSFIEVPRGFSGEIILEAEEETQRKIERVIAQLGNTNQNTANISTSPKVYLAMASKLPSGREQDPGEIIKRVVWMTPEQVREFETDCGFTNSALRKARQFLLKSEDPFLRDIGERI